MLVDSIAMAEPETTLATSTSGVLEAEPETTLATTTFGVLEAEPETTLATTTFGVLEAEPDLDGFFIGKIDAYIKCFSITDTTRK